MSRQPVDNVIAIPTLVGSSLSFLATSVALIFQVAFPPKRHFRHALIVNLLISDFINSLNLTISGIVIMSKGYTTSGASHEPSCVANAWITQFSVQMVDFNILVISITVLMTVTSSRPVAETASLRTSMLLCAATWIPSLITSNIGLALGAYGYVSGNWCWITPDRVGLRYALTHGWRIAIFIATIAIYTIIYIRLRKVFGKARMSDLASSTRNRSMGRSNGGASPADGQELPINDVQRELEHWPEQSHVAGRGTSTTFSSGATDPTPWDSSEIEGGQGQGKMHSVIITSGGAQGFSQMPEPPNIKKMLLLNGYPIAYIILWIPGMANRLAESLGHSPRWLMALQASTQFVGLANALTYGVSEQMRRRIWREWKLRRQFVRAAG